MRRPTRIKNAIWLRVSGEQDTSFFHKPGLDLTPALVFHDQTNNEPVTYAYYRLTRDTSWKMQKETMEMLCAIFMGHPSVIQKRFKHPKTAMDLMAVDR